MPKKIAVIGSGISGLLSASLLSDRHEVTLFEAADYLGGHTHTTPIEIGNQVYAVDTGFIVFNRRTYPNFCKIIDQYAIPICPSEMSFSFHSDRLAIEYNGNNLNTLFADRRNLFNPSFYQFIKDILRFNREAKAFLSSHTADITIGEFIRSRNYQTLFVTTYLVPMIAAIWSKNPAAVINCSAHFLFLFFNNHGLLDIHNRPEWYVIAGGSRNYIPYLIKNYKNRIHLNTKVAQIERHSHGVKLKTHREQLKFDAVVIATHSDQALSLLADATDEEREILNAIPYTSNEAILHSDASVLPKRKRAWASWNYYDIGSEQVTLTYYLNRLQGLKASTPICLSINLSEKIATDKIIRRFSYAHPIFTPHARAAQKRHAHINGKKNTYYCGAYWGFGFHEDGVNSALEVCRLLGVSIL